MNTSTASPNTLDIKVLLDSQKVSRFDWIIFVLCFCIMLFAGFDTTAIGYVALLLLTKWVLTKPDLGAVLTSTLFGLVKCWVINERNKSDY